MSDLNKFVDSIFKGVHMNQRTVDLKEEIYSTLHESACELQKEGYSNEESIKEAISRFGSSKVLLLELIKLYRLRSKFSKWLLAICIIFVVLSISGGLIYYVNSNIYERYVFSVQNKLIDTVKSNDINRGIPDELRNSFRDIVDKKKKGIFDIEVSMRNSNNLTSERLFHYPEDNQNIHSKGLLNEMRSHSLSVRIPGTQNEIGMKIAQYTISDSVYVFSIILFFLYWMLYSVWAIGNMLYERKASATWIIVVLLLNALGYWIYYESNKNPKGRTSLKLLSIICIISGIYIISKASQLLILRVEGDGITIPILWTKVGVTTTAIQAAVVKFYIIGFLCLVLSGGLFFLSKKRMKEVE